MSFFAKNDIVDVDIPGMNKKTLLWIISLIILSILVSYGTLYYLKQREMKLWEKERQKKQEEEIKQIKVSPDSSLPAPGANGEVVTEMPITENEDIKNRTPEELYEQFQPLPPASSNDSNVQQKPIETKKTETFIPKPLSPPSF